MAQNGRDNADDPLAVALATGKSMREATAAASVAERTGWRRWADPAFRAKVAELRAQVVDASLGAMTEGMTEAVETIRRLLVAESEAVRLGAARSIIDSAIKLRENVDFERRILALEAGKRDEQVKPDETADEPGETQRPGNLRPL
jgi:hypothetical protein